MKRSIMMAGAAMMMVAVSASASPQGRLAKCESACESVHPARSAEYDSCIADCQVSSHREAEQGASFDPGRIENDTQIAEGGIGSDGTTYGEDGSVVGNAGQCSDLCSFADDDRTYRQCMADCNETASIEPPTMIANLRIGDPHNDCTTDAYACFHGGDESPAIRDVGIFTASSTKSCRHPWFGCPR